MVARQYAGVTPPSAEIFITQTEHFLPASADANAAVDWLFF
jgi:hypothetical protein